MHAQTASFTCDAAGGANIGQGLDLVRRIAGHMARRLPRHVDREELVALGNLGLVEATMRFDSSRGVPFAAFAARRIRGAIIDGLRAEDMLTRSERTRQRLDDGAPVRHMTALKDAENTIGVEPSAERTLEERCQIDALRRMLPVLTDRERQVVHRHFLDDIRLKQIGEEIGVTESRVCQILAGAINRLRLAMSSLDSNRTKETLQ